MLKTTDHVVAAALPLRLYAVQGYEGRSNDVVYCTPSSETTETIATVVYFGGDMQDFTENMNSHRECKNYSQWNLEDTAKILQKTFTNCHVLVIRPAKIEYKTFSCFKNFVPCNNCGAPDHTPTHYTLQHLEKILQNVSNTLYSTPVDELKSILAKSIDLKGETEEVSDPFRNAEAIKARWTKNLKLETHDLALIGFSKGCVVLNQLLYEFHYLKTLTPDDKISMDIVSKIKDMYWLDGGHSGGKNTWITSRPLLETLTRLGINVHVHVSPYQIQDDRRPWIRKEEKLFSDLLRKLGAPVNRTVHFENVAPNLFMHFDVLNVFRLLNDRQFSQCSNK